VPLWGRWANKTGEKLKPEKNRIDTIKLNPVMVCSEFAVKWHFLSMFTMCLKNGRMETDRLTAQINQVKV